MRKSVFCLAAVLLVVAGCTLNTNTNQKEPVTTSEGEACSLTLEGIEFTLSLNGACTSASGSDSLLILKSAVKTDYFNEPDGSATYGNAPILLTSINNTKPFTFSVKVKPTFINTYDAGTLYIYGDSSDWFKFAFELDERQNTRIVTVRTKGTSDDNNHDVITSPEVFLKVSSNVQSIGFYYSVDQLEWHLVRVFKNEFPSELWMGISAQSPIGEGNVVEFSQCVRTDSSVKDFRMGI